MLGALTVPVTPLACPWGFNPANRSPTTWEWVKHTMCEIENDAGNFWTWLSQEFKDAFDRIWGAILTVSDAFGNLIKPLADWIVKGVEDLAKRLQDEIATFTNAMKLVAIAGAIGVGVYIAYKLDPTSRKRASSRQAGA